MSWYHVVGVTDDEAEKIWGQIGAKVCAAEVFQQNIIPLNEPTEFLSEGDETIVINLAQRILTVIKFEVYHRMSKHRVSQFHPSAFSEYAR